MKIALITGVSGGIGKATFYKFIKNGFFVIGQYNSNQKEIDLIKEDLKKSNLLDYAFFYKCDFNSVKNIQNFVTVLDKNFKHIDVLVNNAGVDLMKLSTETSMEELDLLFNVNFKSCFILSNFCLKSMIERKSGKIVNVSSVWGIKGGSYETVYSATKSALIGYTKALSKEVAPSNINVNCVCPGVIDTKMNANFNKDELKDIINDIPLNRLGTPNEIADVIYFLISEESSYLSGAIISCDGGFGL